MLPDLRWEDATTYLYADRFIPQPCRYVELIARKDDDVEAVMGDLAADAILPWLDGEVSQHRLRTRNDTDIAAFHL
jgi:hypothetical protein